MIFMSCHRDCYYLLALSSFADQICEIIISVVSYHYDDCCCHSTEYVLKCISVVVSEALVSFSTLMYVLMID